MYRFVKRTGTPCVLLSCLNQEQKKRIPLTAWRFPACFARYVIEDLTMVNRQGFRGTGWRMVNNLPVTSPVA